jgi:hypothetical protein
MNLYMRYMYRPKEGANISTLLELRYINFFLKVSRTLINSDILFFLGFEPRSPSQKIFMLSSYKTFSSENKIVSIFRIN